MLVIMLLSRARVVLPLAALALLPACSQARACTAVGGGDFVRVDLRGVPFAGVAQPIEAEVCLNNTCRPRQPVVGSQVFFGGGGDFLSQEPTRVQVKVYSADRLLRQAALTVQPEEYAPNGKECSPAASQARVNFGADNSLRQAPVSER